MRITLRNIKYAAGIVMGILMQLVMIVMFGFTSLEIPFLVYAGCWAACIAMIKWAAGKLQLRSDYSDQCPFIFG